MNPPIFLKRTLIIGPYLQLCLNQEEFDTLCDRLGAPRAPYVTAAGDAAGASMHPLGYGDDGSPVCVVGLRTDPDLTGIEIAGMLVHEAVHVWQAHCEHIGERAASLEFEAYSIQAIAQRLMWAFAERTGVTDGVTAA